MPVRQALIRSADMNDELQQKAVNLAYLAMETCKSENDIAAFIKKEFDKQHTTPWHCVVGRNFGCYVSHEEKHFVYFYLGQIAFLLFKSG